jgi:hypothetical protein
LLVGIVSEPGLLLTLLFKLVIFAVRRAPRVWQQRYEHSRAGAAAY